MEISLISWNVAGWTTTVNLIESRYKSIPSYLDMHQADIFCIQEAKISKKKLATNPRLLAVILPSWESFHSCCVSKRGILGYSGVSTYARVGLTISADCEPFSSLLKTACFQFDENSVIQTCASSSCNAKIEWFGSATIIPGDDVPNSTHSDLNEEGRLLITHHKLFTLFNVYVPNSGPQYTRLSYKMRFLHGLRAKMMEVRANTGLPIILVGDLNGSYRGKDCAPMDGLLDIQKLWGGRDEILSDTSKSTSFSCDETLYNKLQTFGPVIEDYLRDPDKHTLQRTELKLSANQDRPESTVTKYKYSFLLPNGKRCQIGKLFDSEYDASRCLSLNGISVEDSIGESEKQFAFPIWRSDANESLKAEWGRYSYTADTVDGRWIAAASNHINLYHLLECFRALQVHISDEEKEKLSSFCVSIHSPCVRNWFLALLEEDHMIDSFASTYPSFQGRFTVWDQSANKRYTNEGTRLDYILLDQVLYRTFVSPFIDNNVQKHALEPFSPKPLSTSSPGSEIKAESSLTAPHSHAVESHEHAKALATAYDRWKPAPFDGSGLVEASDDAYNSQFCLDKTIVGMIYTPPKYSDHIAICCRMQAHASGLKMDDISVRISDLYPNPVKWKVELDMEKAFRGFDNSFYVCELNGCERTRKAQPHKQWRSILSFFTPASGATKNAEKRKGNTSTDDLARNGGKSSGSDTLSESIYSVGESVADAKLMESQNKVLQVARSSTFRKKNKRNPGMNSCDLRAFFKDSKSRNCKQ